ncbi:perilipin-3-like [Antechinus flavipes]|uniref:perilipin-3-like n=1 Tax=Antechinus flavipes TaxID=38775 RepID=UPI00223690A5|nr:perilipin-3-like [Antechinus flavipes]
MSSTEPKSDSSAHAAEPASQGVLASVGNVVLVSPTSNKDWATSASLKKENLQLQPTDEAPEENLPVFLQASPSQVTAIPSLASRAKNVVASIRIRDLSVAFQSGLDITKSKFAIDTKTASDLAKFDQRMLDSTDESQQSEEGDAHYLPMTDDELAEIAEIQSSGEWKIPSLQQQRKTQRYFVRLGSLPLNLHQQAIEYSVVKLEQIKQNVFETHLQLSQIISLINNVKQTGTPWCESQEKLDQIWVHWNRLFPTNNKQDAAKIESRTLLLFMKLFYKLLNIILLLLSSTRGLYDDIWRKIRQSLYCIREYEATLANLNSFQDLSCKFINLIQEESSKILAFLDQIQDNLAEDKPFTWIMGPFVPSNQGSQKAEKTFEKVSED